MKLEYKVWNIHKDWQPLEATTLDAAERELARGDPWNEEAIIRNVETGQTYQRIPSSEGPDFGPF